MDVQLDVPQMFYQLPSIPNREKYNKLCKSNTVICLWGVEPFCISQISHR
jgi:hypothetical protein